MITPTVYRRPCPCSARHQMYVLYDHGWRLLCRSGCCTQAKMLRALGLPPSALKGETVARYVYRDADGTALFEVARHAPKRFTVSGSTVPGSLYRLTELLATQLDVPVFWVEGEKDVETLRGRGLTAVTTSHGAHTPVDARVARHFAGRQVIILPDNDEPGRDYAERVRQLLEPVAAGVRVVNLPVGYKQDASDYLDHGGTVAALMRLCGLPVIAADSTDPSVRLGRVEQAIIAAVRRHGTMTTDRLPGEIMGLPAEKTWNGRAGREMWRYPQAASGEIRSARASISRALSRLRREGLIIRIGSRLRLPNRIPMFHT